MIVGYAGVGSFTQRGGTCLISNALMLAESGGGIGTFDLNGGLLSLGGSGLLSGAGSSTFNFTGGTLQAGSSWSTSVPITLATSSGSATFDTNGNTLTLNGSLSGPGGLTKAGSGMLLLTSSNSFSGPTTIVGGTLQIANAMSLQNSTVLLSSSGGTLNLNGLSATLGGLSGNGNLTLASGTISVGNDGVATSYSGVLSGVGGLNKIGSGSLALLGSNSYQGNTTVSGGVLESAAINAFSPNSNLSISGGTLDATQFPQTINSLSIGGAGVLNLAAGNVLTTSGSANFGGTLNLMGASGGTLDLINYLLHSGSFSTATGIPLGYMLSYTPTQLDLLVTPPNLWAAAVSGSWSNAGNWTNGVPSGDGVIVTINPPTTNSLTVSLTSPETIGSLTLGNSASATTGYSLVGNGSNALTISNSGFGATITVTGGSHVVNTPIVLADNLTVAGSNFGWSLVLGGSNGNITGSKSLTLNGNAHLTLGGNNSYSGGTTIDAGLLQLGSNGALGVATGALSVNAGTLDLHGFGTSVGALIGNGLIDNLAAAPVTFTMGNGDATSTFSGKLQNSAGTLTLDKVGSGTITLAGNDSFRGGLRVSDGTVVLDGIQSLLTGSSLTIGGGPGPGAIFFSPLATSQSPQISARPRAEHDGPPCSRVSLRLPCSTLC